MVEDEVISTSSFISIAPNVAKKFFTKGTLSSLIMMITSIQLLVHIALVNVQFPGNASILYEELIHYVTYEILPSSKIFPAYFDFPDRGALNERFERLDYGYFYSIMLLGCIVLAILWMLLLYPVYLLLKICRLKFIWPQKMLQSLHRTLFWK